MILDAFLATLGVLLALAAVAAVLGLLAVAVRLLTHSRPALHLRALRSRRRAWRLVAR